MGQFFYLRKSSTSLIYLMEKNWKKTKLKWLWSSSFIPAPYKTKNNPMGGVQSYISNKCFNEF